VIDRGGAERPATGRRGDDGQSGPTLGAVRQTNIFNTAHARAIPMSLEMDHYCPVCEETRSFWLTASTELHLGEKTKWRCPECDYGLVLIGEGVDSSAADA